MSQENRQISSIFAILAIALVVSSPGFSRAVKQALSRVPSAGGA
jgi:hypothetical protein